MKRFIFLLFVFTEAKSQIPCDHPRGIISSTEIFETLKEKPVIINPSSFVEECNVNDSIKKRLRYLLRWQWTKNEINEYYKKNLDTYKNIYLVDEKARKISNGNDSIYKISKDSIEYEIIKNELKYDIEHNHIFNVKKELVLTIGWLNMKETVRFLKDSALNSKYYDKVSVELALARMGDKKLQKKIIAACRNSSNIKEDFVNDYNNKFCKLVYIGTQESLYQLHEFIDTSKYIPLNSKGTMTSFALKIVQNFKTVFGNDEINKLIKLTGDEYDYDTKSILAIKQWIIKNKGKYIIEKGFCPY
jgi:hypothetical protein